MTILLSIALFTVAVAFKPFGTRFGSSFKASKPSPRSVTTADVAKPMFKDGSRLKLFQGSGDIVADAVSHDAQFGPGAIPYALRKATQIPSLHEYVRIGNRLKDEESNSGLPIIEKGITQFVDAVPESLEGSTVFAYLDGSSGLGKTQLAFALKRPVLYIPLGNSQAIYKCFEGLYDVVNEAVKADMLALRMRPSTEWGEFSTRHIKEASVYSHKYFTISVLLKMLELFAMARKNGSNVLSSGSETNVFLSADCKIRLEGMTLYEGREAAERYSDVLIYVDEIPALDTTRMTPVQECLFLRNIIRCLRLPCLLSGTESTLLDMMALVKGSRCAGFTEYAWLLTKFPTTQIDQQRVEFGRFGAYEQHLLCRSRPLFVQWFAGCFRKQSVAATVAAAPQGDGTLLHMTPDTLTKMKRKICRAKANKKERDAQLSWLHASAMLIFADSLAGHGEVTATVVARDAAHEVGARKQRVGDLRDNVMKHSNAIRNHFALLYIPSELIDSTTGMAKLFVEGETLHNSDESPFKALAAYPTCAQDPLLYLACLRGGLMWRGGNGADGADLVEVPSSYALSTFYEQTGVGNSQARSNDGKRLEGECMAAAVLAAHRYSSFTGTPFLRWLALMVAELSQHELFHVTPIEDVPEELVVALQAVQVPLLSPPNCPWGKESKESGINVADLEWCKNCDMRDGLVPLRNIEAARGVHGEEENLGFTTMALEVKDTLDGFGGNEMASVTKKVPEGCVAVLVSSHLAEWTRDTIGKFEENVSVYRMTAQGSIECASSHKWAPGKRLLIALDLNSLHPGRYEAIPHST